MLIILCLCIEYFILSEDSARTATSIRSEELPRGFYTKYHSIHVVHRFATEEELQEKMRRRQLQERPEQYFSVIDLYVNGNKATSTDVTGSKMRYSIRSVVAKNEEHVNDLSFTQHAVSPAEIVTL